MSKSPSRIIQVYCGELCKSSECTPDELNLLNYAINDLEPNVTIGYEGFIFDPHTLSDRILDLLQISSMVFCADRMSRRGERESISNGSWARSFEFHISVLDHEFWNQDNPVMKECVNKFTVREYVKAHGLENILVPLYAHYKWTEDIEWDKLPESFVIKTQHGGGGLNVIVVPDKSLITREEVVKKLHYSTGFLSEKSGGREWAYGGLETGIIVEKLLVNSENPRAGINDYKVFCYNGHAKYIIVDVDRYIGHKRNFYDCRWNNLHVTSDCPASDREIPRPENLDEMLSVAEELSGDFPYVRVDLYNISGVIYFGELTFYPWSGYVQFAPDEWDFKFGEEFELRSFG